MLQRLLSKSLVFTSRYQASHGAPKPREDFLDKAQIQKLEKFMTIEPDYTERFSSPGKLIPLIKPLSSSTFIKLLCTAISEPSREAVSDSYFPPKIHENSIFVFQSQTLGNIGRYTRSTDFILAAFVVGGATMPLYAITVFGSAYLMFLNAFMYEIHRRSVVRMDILPQSHSLNIQKVGAFGILYNRVIRIDDIVHVDFMEMQQKENYFWGLHYKHVDHNLIFKDKNSGELFMFDRQGWWNKKGLEHELLN